MLSSRCSAALPTCWICQRPVDRFIKTYDHLQGGFVFTVHCHGDVASVFLPDYLVVEIENLEDIKLDGWCFRPVGLLR